METGNVENVGIDSQTDAEFSEYVSGLSAAEAKETVDKIMREASVSTSHPYSRASDPGHRRMVERVQRLFERSHADDPDDREYDENGQVMQNRIDPRVSKICNEALADQAKKQNVLVVQGDKLLQELRNLGYEGEITNCPKDVDQDQLNIWSMQKLNAEGNYRGLGDMIGKALRDSKQSQPVQQLFQTFLSVEAELDPDLKQNLTHQILSYLNDAAKARRALKPKVGKGK